MVSLDLLRGKNAEAVWFIFDRLIDIEIALTYPQRGRQVDPKAQGRWPNCPSDVLRMLDNMDQESILRLRHFAALVIADIRIADKVYRVTAEERAAIDARLSGSEKIVAKEAWHRSATRDLLWLR